MSTKEDARAGRGASNTGNKNWYSSPLWDNIGPAARKKKETQESVDSDSVVCNDSNGDKERAKKLYNSIY